MWLALGMMYEVVLSGISLFSVVSLPKFETAVIILLVVFVSLMIFLRFFSKKSSAKFRWHTIYSIVSFGFLINFFIQFFSLERANMNKGHILIFCIIWAIAIFFRFNKYWVDWLHDQKRTRM